MGREVSDEGVGAQETPPALIVDLTLSLSSYIVSSNQFNLIFCLVLLGQRSKHSCWKTVMHPV